MALPLLPQGMELVHPALTAGALFIIVVVGLLILRDRLSGLANIPGPFLARYTDAWSLYAAWKLSRGGSSRVSHHQNLHKRFGDVIRIGPRSVAVLDPAAVPVIYGVRSKLDKGDAYIPFRQAGVTTSLLSIPDEKSHARYRKLVSHAYSMSSLKGYEPYVDEMVERFVEVCDQYAQTKEMMNISLWCLYYCFDVVSKITMGTPLGFMDGEGKDMYNLIGRIREVGRYVSVVSQMPWLHKVFQDNPFMRKANPSPFLGVVRSTITQRLDTADPESQERPDLLSHFVSTHKQNPLMDMKQVAISTSGNLLAGSLSPGSTFDTLCRYLATHPDSQDRLYAELVSARCPLPAAFDDVKDLPYLGGVIREAYRLHASTSFNLQRVTGPSGLTLPNGCHIPAKTKIGCPAESINQDIRVFGADPSLYKPERWMRGEHEDKDSYQERRNLMDRTDLSFGQGSRTCIGKNITHLEIFKVVATLMAQYKFDVVGVPKKAEVFVTVTRRIESEKV